MNTQFDPDELELDPDGAPYAESWAISVTDSLERSTKRAWAVAIFAAIVAAAQALALVYLLPLKTVEPYTLLVDRQTGNVEALAPLDQNVIAPDAALTRSLLVQYVIARESFSFDGLQDDYRKVSLWSAGPVRSRYQLQMQASNPQSPLSALPRRAVLRTEVRSVSSLSENRSLVRFATYRADQGANSQPAQLWAAIIDYQFSGAAMSEADRLINPLGFQVTRYRRDVETLVEEIESGASTEETSKGEAS